jgi:hypothetical protein
VSQETASPVRDVVRPVGPEILALATSVRARSSRARARSAASAKSATRWPQVSGVACIPCVRPIRPVLRCFMACRHNAITKPVARSMSRLDAAVSWSARQVSTMSELVRPRWTQHAASSGIVFVHTSRNATTSCFVLASAAAISAKVGMGALRAVAAANSGVSPRATRASSTASSTARHPANAACGSQPTASGNSCIGQAGDLPRHCYRRIRHRRLRQAGNHPDHLLPSRATLTARSGGRRELRDTARRGGGRGAAGRRVRRDRQA